MSAITYDTTAYEVRPDLVAAQQLAWDRIGAPGDWLDGATRVAVAQEVRHAPSCALCRRRKEALSPFAVDGAHDAAGSLGEATVDVIHRITTDPGRLSRDWLQGVLASGMDEAEYVETVGIVAVVMIVDTFVRGLGLAPFALPEPQPGAPRGYRAPGAKRHDAWIADVDPEDIVDADGVLYDGPRVAPVMRALSQVPDAQRHYWDLAQVHYLPNTELMNFAVDLRAIDRARIELIAARVSALHQCVY